MTDTLSILPTPTVIPPSPDYYNGGKPQRVREYRWPITGGTGRLVPTNPGDQLYVSLRVSHGSKTFVVRAGEVMAHGDGKSEGSWPMDDLTLDRFPAVRYSEKALDAYAAQVLADLTVTLARNETAAALFRPVLDPGDDSPHAFTASGEKCDGCGDDEGALAHIADVAEREAQRALILAENGYAA